MTMKPSLYHAVCMHVLNQIIEDYLMLIKVTIQYIYIYIYIYNFLKCNTLQTLTRLSQITCSRNANRTQSASFCAT